MDEIEEVEGELRHGLRFVPAPAGFTERVMRRVAEREAACHVAAQRKERRTGVFMGAHRHAAWWTAAAAALALAAGGGDMLHVRHQQHMREAAAAQAQVELAMQLTSHALNEVEAGFHRSHAGRFTQFLNETER